MYNVSTEFQSRPVWGAWIEMDIFFELTYPDAMVAPRMGRVD